MDIYISVKSNYAYTILPLKEIKLMQQRKRLYSVSDYCYTTFLLTLEEEGQELYLKVKLTGQLAKA